MNALFENRQFWKSAQLVLEQRLNQTGAYTVVIRFPNPPIWRVSSPMPAKCSAINKQTVVKIKAFDTVSEFLLLHVHLSSLLPCTIRQSHVQKKHHDTAEGH